MVTDFTVLPVMSRYKSINAKFFTKSDLKGNSKVREVVSKDEIQILIAPIVVHRSDVPLRQMLL